MYFYGEMGLNMAAMVSFAPLYFFRTLGKAMTERIGL